ncbi:MFS transporter [Litorihabitans aurantiacus]|uniref:MFS transporter n=1 Tax=Litorihabitans aurantiacus TaxID=1930061 RepID=A0AA37XGF5_9MICO|nr:MFS transporter [Litorihabitans aurantiacus]GMA33178.1 MFS transporter [Litorihabitans aurantiacus]
MTPPAPPTPTPDHAHLQRRVVTLLSVAQVLSGVAAGSIVSVGSLIAVDLTGNDAWAGSVTTTTTLGAALASLLLAQVAAARGRRPALAGGLAVAALGAVGIIGAALLGSVALLLAGAALMGCGQAVNLQARFAATDLAAPRTRSRDLSLVVWMSTVGAVAGPNLIAVAESVARTTGLPVLAAAFAPPVLGLLAGMVVLAVGLRPDPLLVSRTPVPDGAASPSHVGAPREGAADEGGGAPPSGDMRAAGPAAPRPPRASLAAGLRALRTHPSARAALVAILGAHAVMVAVMAMTPVHLQHHGATLQVVGLTVSLHIAGMYALAPVMGLLADRLGARHVVVGGLGVLVLAVGVAGVSGSSAGLTTAGLVLLGLGWSAVTVAGAAMIAASVTGPERVNVQGLSDALMSLAGAGGGALSGVGLAWVGYGGLNLAAGVVAVGVGVVVVSGVRRGAAEV